MTEELFLENFNNGDVIDPKNFEERIEILLFLKDHGYTMGTFAEETLHGIRFGSYGIVLCENLVHTVRDTATYAAFHGVSVMSYDDFLNAVNGTGQICMDTNDFSALWEDE